MNQPVMFRQENPSTKANMELARRLIESGSSTAPVGSTLEGVARLAQAMSGAYIQRETAKKDEKERREANASLVRGVSAKPWQPPQGELITDEEGYEIPPAIAAQNAQRAGGLDGASYALSQMPDNFHAQQMAGPMALQAAMHRQSREEKAADRQAQLANAKELQSHAADLKPGAAQWSPIIEGGQIVGQKNSQTGEIKADPRASKEWVPVPGLGVFNTRTQKMLSAFNREGQPSGPPSPVAALPKPSTAPGIVSPKGRETAATQELSAANAELRKEREMLPEIDRIARLSSRFEQLMEAQNTGGVLRRLPGAQTIERAIDPEIDEMASLQDQITPLMRQGMPGSASDRDVAMFRGGAFGTQKDKQTNSNLITGFKTAGQNARDRLAFREAYVSQNGTLRGAEEAWAGYLKANPIFAPGSPVTSPALNPKRKTWKEHFGGGVDYKSKYGLD